MVPVISFESRVDDPTRGYRMTL
eukprot:SAG31_NODE_646_length_13223_cov_14.088845_13_plen_22_part_01